jgi:hypothetical protein
MSTLYTAQWPLPTVATNTLHVMAQCYLYAMYNIIYYKVVGGAAYMFKLCPQLAAGTTLGLLSVAAIAQAHGAFNRHMAERTQVTCHLCYCYMLVLQAIVNMYTDCCTYVRA